MPRDKQAILLELLVLRCKKGDKSAFDELVRQWEGRLGYFVRRLVATEEDAWDILQQTWIKVFKGIRSLNDPQRLPTWLYRIARCTAMSHWRSHHRDQARIEENADLEEFAAPDDGHRFEDAERVHFALGRVSLAHREVLTLYFLEDLSLEQMADSTFRWARSNRVYVTPSVPCGTSSNGRGANDERHKPGIPRTVIEVGAGYTCPKGTI